MNRRILFLLACLLPLSLFSQIYRYTKETRVEYNGKNAVDTVYLLEAQTRIEVQIKKNTVTIVRPRNGSGEPLNIDVYTIRRLTKSGTDAKITTKEGYTFNIYPDGISVHYKKDNKRVDYGFYNGTNRKFLYE
jgi:hypothetical protein